MINSESTENSSAGVSITPVAAEQILSIRKMENIPDEFALRIGVQGGGCSGFSYVLGFDDQVRPSDKQFQSQGVTLVIDEKSLYYLMGTELDFHDGEDGKGFIFHNPNAAPSCGCGDSFDV